MKKQIILIMMLFFNLLSVSFAESEKGIKLKELKNNEGRRWAILIGINKYQDKDISDLKKAKNDAQALGDILKNQGQFDNVYIMTDDNGFDSTDYPSYFKIKDRLNYISKFLKPEDLVVFSFSGHGVTIDGDSHLIVSDSRVKNMKETTINLEKDVVAMLNKAGIKKSLLLIDACRKNFRENKGIAGEGLKTKIFERAEVAATFYATKTGWYSYEDTESDYGAFTRFILEGLQGYADREKGNNDGIVSFRELSGYVEEEVFNWALKNDKEQRPYTKIYGESYGDLALSIAMKNPGDITLKRNNKDKIDNIEIDLIMAKIEKAYTQKDYDKTIELVDNLKKITADVPAKAYFLLGNSYMNNPDTQYYSMGIKAFKDYLKRAGRDGEYYSEAIDLYLELEELIKKEESKSMIPDNMVYVEGGSFQMGSDAEPGSDNPLHNVTLSGFLIGKFEVTQAEYRELMGDNPSHFAGENRPVEMVSWWDAITYCNALSLKEGLAPAYNSNGDLIDKYGNITLDVRKVEGYRLPTEAEWEFAAHGGRKSKGYIYSGSNQIENITWYRDNSKDQTHPIGGKELNELGIYDMTGNVWEWCQDWYATDAYTNHNDTNPYISNKTWDRVRRGGSWSTLPKNSQIVYRGNGEPSSKSYNSGFRIARSF